MKQLTQVINVLVILAALAFLVGVFANVILGDLFWGLRAVTYWRGALGLLAFAMTLILIQIRDKS